MGPGARSTTPSQTVGPFFAIDNGLLWPDGPDIVPPGTPGSFLITGHVRDGAGNEVPDAMIESWQADSAGRFAHPADPRGCAGAFRGFGRCGTDSAGKFWLRTVKPGPLPTPAGEVESPHINVTVFARGLLNRLVTRLYFSDEPANDADPVLSTIDIGRRSTLMATKTDAGYRFDIRLQGDDETVFFTV